jgi:hypothetical protein
MAAVKSPNAIWGPRFKQNAATYFADRWQAKPALSSLPAPKEDFLSKHRRKRESRGE